MKYTTKQQSIEPEEPDEWKTCCVSLPEGIPTELAQQAIFSKRCDKMLTCLTREDLDDVAMEFLCPKCGFLVRRMTRNVTSHEYKQSGRGYPSVWGECPAGKKVLLVLIHCVACRNKEET